MKTPTLPLSLYKANLDLWLRIGELLEENRNQWTTLMARELQQGATGSGFDLDALRRGDWQTLALLPGQALQRLAAHGVSDLQAAAQTALGNQMTFATGFQQALADWQQATVEALGDAAGTDDGADAQAVLGQAWQDLLAWPDTLAGLVPGGLPRAPDAAGTPAQPGAPAAARSRGTSRKTATTAPTKQGAKRGTRAARKAPATTRGTTKKTAKKRAAGTRAATGTSAAAANGSGKRGSRAAAKKTVARKAAKKTATGKKAARRNAS